MCRYKLGLVKESIMGNVAKLVETFFVVAMIVRWHLTMDMCCALVKTLYYNILCVVAGL